MRGKKDRALRRWEKWLLELALRAWPGSARLEDGPGVLATIEERRRSEGSLGSWPTWLDTLREAADIVITGVRLRAEARVGDTGRGRPSEYARSLLRHGFRGVVRDPLWSALAVLVLAVGLGSGVAVFSVVDGVALRPLPYERPGELLRLGSTREGRPGLSATSGPNFRDLESASTTLVAVAASLPASVSIGLPDGTPELFRCGFVSGDFFAVLGLGPLVGRPLGPEDDTPGAPLAVVLSHGVWRSRFGGGAVVGTSVLVDDRPATVVGVMPPDFYPPEGVHLGGTSLWMPLSQAQMPLENRDLSGLDMVGRMAPGASADQVGEELAAIGHGILEAYDLHPRQFSSFAARPLRDETLGDSATTLRMLLAAVTLLLAVACLNVGNLVLLRAIDHAENLRVRLCLGATHLRVVAEAGIETVCLALVAGALGTSGAWAAVTAVRRSAPVDLPRLSELTVDGRVTVVALAVSVVVGLLVGVVPALRVVAGDLRSPGGSGRVSSSRGSVRARDGLVLVQVSLGMALAVGAGLLMQSLVRLHQVDPGLDPEDLYVATLRVRGIGGADFDPTVLAEMERRTEAHSGVVSASLSSGSPYTPGGRIGYIDPEGIELTDQEVMGARIEFHRVSGGHLQDLGVRLVQGRDLAPTDTEGGEPVVVISESLARAYWPEGNALGSRLVLGGDGTFTPRTVVGIAANARYRGPGSEPEEHVWVPYSQLPLQPLDLVVRTREGVSPLQALNTVTEDLGRVVALRSVRSVEVALGRHFTGPTFFTTLLGAFAGVALLLAAIGLYSTLAHSVRSRRRELGVRMALGADGGRLTRGVVLRGLAVSVLGVVAGLGLAAIGANLLDAFLFGTRPGEPSVWAGAAAFMLLVGVLASWLPARMAGRVAPSVSLRAE